MSSIGKLKITYEEELMIIVFFNPSQKYYMLWWNFIIFIDQGSLKFILE